MHVSVHVVLVYTHAHSQKNSELHSSFGGQNTECRKQSKCCCLLRFVPSVSDNNMKYSNKDRHNNNNNEKNAPPYSPPSCPPTCFSASPSLIAVSASVPITRKSRTDTWHHTQQNDKKIKGKEYIEAWEERSKSTKTFLFLFWDNNVVRTF